MKLPSLPTFLHWLDEHILFLLGGFLLAFIPLYPKLPLFDILPGYIVRVRIEDFFILFSAIVWLIQVLRKKVAWKSPVFWMIVVYAIAGLLSTISAVVITKTVPAQLLHIGKTSLHYFRYLEYFTMFVILYSGVKTKLQAKVLLGVLTVTVLLVTLYGYGQRYFYWPVYSTMNREFSKGVRLYLTEHARVQSTFGGHYDLAAYLVVALPFILALAFAVKKWYLKVALQIVHWVGVWLLISSASRTSFVGYVAGAFLVLLISMLNQTGWLRKLAWGFSRTAFVFGLLAIMMLAFGDEIYNRFVQVLEGYPQVYAQYQALETQKNNFVETTLPVALGLKKIVPVVEKPPEGIAVSEADQLDPAAQNALVSSDERPTTTKPSDVYGEQPNDIVEVASVSASGEATVVMVDRGPRTYSDCALEKGLSLCIRLETLWPQAIAGFKRNPIFGSGYATLTKSSVGEFTEAESTDNNFLRTLGETGLFGFISFYGVIVAVLWITIRQMFDKDIVARALSIGFLAASVGLLINAIYIDVFAASKVAQSYWAIAGIVVAYMHLNRMLPDQSVADIVSEPTPAPMMARPITKINPGKKAKKKSKLKKSK